MSNEPLANTTLALVRGDTKTYRLAFYADTAQTTPLDLAGATIFFTAKAEADEDITDAEAVISKTITSISNPTLGIVDITLTPTNTKIDTGKYKYDVQLKDSDGNIITVLRGDLFVSYEVTARAS